LKKQIGVPVDCQPAIDRGRAGSGNTGEDITYTWIAEVKPTTNVDFQKPMEEVACTPHSIGEPNTPLP